MKKIILEWDEWTQSKAFMLHQVPKAIRGFIYFTALLVVSVILFITWGEVEETVSAGGTIRPPQNISLVKPGISGKIETLSFYTGQSVLEGDVLMTVDKSILEASRRSLDLQLRENTRQSAGWKDMEKRLFQSNNTPVGDREFANRWDSYLLDTKRLSILSQQAYRAWEEETNLPPLMTSSSKIRELKESKDLAKISLDRYKEDFVGTIRQNIQNTELAQSSLQSLIVQSEQSLDLATVKAPLSGIVWETSKFNPGDMVSAGLEICRIIPNQIDNFKVEMQVRARDGGKLNPGMLIRYRFPAFPYTEFGTVEATIKSISPDSTVSSSGEPFFIITGELPVMELKDRKGKAYALKSGLQVESWIILRKRPIWSFLLEKLGY